MEDRVRQELADIVGAKPDSRLVTRLWAIVAREVIKTREAYDAYTNHLQDTANGHEVRAL